MTDAHPEVSLVVPAFNEAARLPSALAQLEQHFRAHPIRTELILVDDGSRDATPQILAGAVSAFPANVHVRRFRHLRNRGKGGAVRTGCLAATGRFILFIDADLAVPLDEMDKLLAALRDGSDVAIGSRIQPDGSDMRASQPLRRRLGGKAFTWLRQRLAVPEIVDTQCPMKGFRAEAAPRIFARQKLNGWAFDAEILFLARRAGLTIREIPVQWRHMEGSKLQPGVRLALRSLRDLIKLRLVHLGGR